MFRRIFKKKKIVLIFDAEERYKQLIAPLNNAGFEPIFFDRAENISANVIRFNPDIIIVGFSLPHMRGEDYLRELRFLRVEAPIVVVSDVDTLETKLLARSYGATRFRVRPITGERLAITLKRTLEVHEGKYLKRIFPHTKEEAESFAPQSLDSAAWESLKALTDPASVAIIGASETPGKASERRTRSLIEGGYRGQIFPINPKRETIFGYKAYKSILDIPADTVDLTMIVLARDMIVQAVRDAVKKGSKAIIVITAGLGESDTKGKEIEDEILQISKEGGARVVGPNCSGVFSASSSLNLLGLPSIKKGPFSVIAQSGNVIDSLCLYAAVKNAGFSKIFSAGNAIGFSFHEYLEFLNRDPDTRVIMLYLESVKEGPEFIKAARNVVANKPIIAIKVGNSEASRRAAASHTAAMATAREITNAAFRQAGIVRARNVDEIFDLAEALAYCPVPAGARVAVLSEGGGDNAIAAENAEAFGLSVPVFSADLQKEIKKHLLKNMPAHNPVDYGGVAEENPTKIADIAEICLKSDEVDSVLITGFYGGFTELISETVNEIEMNTAGRLADLVFHYGKPLIVHSSFSRTGSDALEILKRARIPVYESSGRAARALAALAEYGQFRKKISEQETPRNFTRSQSAVKVADDIICQCIAEKRSALLEPESVKLLKAFNLPVNDAVFVSDPEELESACEQIGYPLVMKIVSERIIHKSDSGGVALNLQNYSEVQDAYRKMMERIIPKWGRESLRGVVVSPMVDSGDECIVGMIRDPVYGPVVMFGLGGIFVEIMGDFSFRVAPLMRDDPHEMIREIKGYKILSGFRGREKKDIAALEDVIVKLSELSLSDRRIKEIDLNPVIVRGDGAVIVDSRIILGD